MCLCNFITCVDAVYSIFKKSKCLFKTYVECIWVQINLIFFFIVKKNLVSY